VIEWLKKTEDKDTVFLHAVHRLDKEVSGMVLFARSSKALKRLHEMIRNQEIERIYLAVVEGKIHPKEDTLVHYLKHGSHRALIVKKGEEGAKEAILSYQVVKENNSRSLLQVTLKTGRYHQIRAQLSHIGYPIIGDKKYGSKIEVGRVLLHHHRLSFVHPVKKERMTFICPIDFF
jgi:23S rRNA pseudouridine1911/1915/1917 synthase